MSAECTAIEQAKLIETDRAHLSHHLPALLRGEMAAVLVKNFLTPLTCQRVAENFAASPGRYKRMDGVPATMVGTNGFLKDVEAMQGEYASHSRHGELLFRGAENAFRQFFDCIEDSGFRVRPAFADGVAIPAYRAAMWDDASQVGVVLKAHTDWPQVANSCLEYSDVAWPIGVNMYAAHPPKGLSWVRLHDFIPPHDWLEARGIALGGYPIEEAELIGRSFIDIYPEAGDMLLFSAAYVHSVHVADGVTAMQRLNINGFVGVSKLAQRVLAWA